MGNVDELESLSPKSVGKVADKLAKSCGKGLVGSMMMMSSPTAVAPALRGLLRIVSGQGASCKTISDIAN